MHIGNVQAVTSNRLAVDIHRQSLLTREALDTYVRTAGDALQNACHLLGDFLEVFQLVPEHLHGQLRAHAGHHFIHTLGDGLGQHNLHAGNLGQALTNLFIDLILGTLGLGVQQHDGV